MIIVSFPLDTHCLLSALQRPVVLSITAGEKLKKYQWSYCIYTFYHFTVVWHCTWVIKHIQHTKRNAHYELQWHGFVTGCVHFQMITSVSRDYICTHIVCVGRCWYLLKARLWSTSGICWYTAILQQKPLRACKWNIRWKKMDAVWLLFLTLCQRLFCSRWRKDTFSAQTDRGHIEQRKKKDKTGWSPDMSGEDWWNGLYQPSTHITSH